MSIEVVGEFLDLRIGCRTVNLCQRIVGSFALKNGNRLDSVPLQLRIQFSERSIVQDAFSFWGFTLCQHKQRVFLHIQ